MIAERLTLSCGISLPFLPMRPTPGVRCTETQLVNDLATGRYVLQPKLNGDRVTVGVFGNRVLAFNRHLAGYSFPIKNLDRFKSLPDGTCLDGEVWKSGFYPFETLSVGSDLIIDCPVELRIAIAKGMCLSDSRCEWLFDEPRAGWVTTMLAAGMASKKTIEGYVRKLLGSKYVIQAVEREDPAWFKLRWC